MPDSENPELDATTLDATSPALVYNYFSDDNRMPNSALRTDVIRIYKGLLLKTIHSIVR
jgi:hypothetical protein